MRYRSFMRTALFLLLAGASSVFAQVVDPSQSAPQAVGSFVTAQNIGGTEAVRVVKDPAILKDDEPTFAKLAGEPFRNGTIEVKVRSKLLKDAPEHARGFIGRKPPASMSPMQRWLLMSGSSSESK